MTLVERLAGEEFSLPWYWLFTKKKTAEGANALGISENLGGDKHFMTCAVEWREANVPSEKFAHIIDIKAVVRGGNDLE